jgi:hypothetical protein
MTLLESILITLPQSPQPPDDNLKKISDALELAITIHIRVAFVPVGFGVTFAQAAPQNPFILLLGQYLESTISPFISTAASAQATIGPLPAWASVIPGITALQPFAPPFMPGIFGVQFWTAILITIIASLPPPPPEEISGSSESTSGESTEVLRIDT